MGIRQVQEHFEQAARERMPRPKAGSAPACRPARSTTAIGWVNFRSAVTAIGRICALIVGLSRPLWRYGCPLSAICVQRSAEAKLKNLRCHLTVLRLEMPACPGHCARFNTALRHSVPPPKLWPQSFPRRKGRMAKAIEPPKIMGAGSGEKERRHSGMTGLSGARMSQRPVAALGIPRASHRQRSRVYDAAMTGPHRLPCETPDAHRARLTRRRLVRCDADTRWVLPVTILGSSMPFIDGSVVNVAIPAIGKDLGADLRNHSMGRERLHADARQPDPDRRRGGRPVWPPACLY